MVKDIKKQLRKSCEAYIKAFEKQTELELEYAVGDDYLGILCFSDFYFSFNDIVYVVDNKISFETLLQWYDFNMENEQKINLDSWVWGCPRYTDAERESARVEMEETKKHLLNCIENEKMGLNK